MHNESTGTYRPMWLRFLLNTSDSREGAALTSEFRIDISSGLLIATSVTSEKLVAGAFIVSRYDDGWRRSTQSLLVLPSVLSLVTGEDARAAAIASYQDAASVVTSDVYLNGSVGASSQGGPLMIPVYFKGSADSSYSSLVRTGKIIHPLSVGLSSIEAIDNLVVVNGIDDGGAVHQCYVCSSRVPSGGGANIVQLLRQTDTFIWTGVSPSAKFSVVSISDGDTGFIDFLVSNGIPSSVLI